MKYRQQGVIDLDAAMLFDFQQSALRLSDEQNDRITSMVNRDGFWMA